MLYTSDSIHWKETLEKRLDACGIALMRILLKVPPPHVSRISHAEIKRRIKTLAPKLKLTTISERSRSRAETLLGHVMRARAGDPMFDVSFDAVGMPRVPIIRKVGRPRKVWLEETAKRVFQRETGRDMKVRERSDWSTLHTLACTRAF